MRRHDTISTSISTHTQTPCPPQASPPTYYLPGNPICRPPAVFATNRMNNIPRQPAQLPPLPVHTSPRRARRPCHGHDRFAGACRACRAERGCPAAFRQQPFCRGIPSAAGRVWTLTWRRTHQCSRVPAWSTLCESDSAVLRHGTIDTDAAGACRFCYITAQRALQEKHDQAPTVKQQPQN